MRQQTGPRFPHFSPPAQPTGFVRKAVRILLQSEIPQW
jgi:hypothetical protein